MQWEEFQTALQSLARRSMFMPVDVSTVIMTAMPIEAYIAILHLQACETKAK